MTVYQIIRICPRKISIIYAIFIIAGVQISRSTTKTINDGTVCQTPLCKQIAEIIINTVNQTVDPCQDFFQYACGNIGAKHPTTNLPSMNFFGILQNATSHRIKEILESASLPNENIAIKKSKQLYRACMDTNAIEKEGLTSLLKLIDELGGWPITMEKGKWESRQKPWQEVDLMIRKNMGRTSLFIMSVTSDPKNSTSYIQWLSRPTLPGEAGIYTHSFLPKDNITAAMKNPGNIRYRQVIVDTAKVIAKYQKSSVTTAQLEADATDVTKFEIELLHIVASASINATLNVNKNHEQLTIDELQKKCDALFPKTSNGKIHWLSYIRHLYSDTPGVNIDGSEKLAIVTQEYFLELIDFLDRTPSRVIVNAMHWWLVKELAITLKPELKSLIYDQTIEKSRPRWKFCVARNGLKHAIAQAYIQKHPLTSKPYIVEMVNEIMASMRTYIFRSKWLDHNSKSEALKKLSQMRAAIGYPEWYESDRIISSFYKDLIVDDSFYDNTLSLSKFNFQSALGALRLRVNKQSWVGIPTDVNAYYHYTGNSLTLPAAILQFPVFDITQPDVVNYGALGFIIGHEISHGFDSRGRLYDGNGNLRDWWTNTIKSEYDKKTKCFVDKFSRYGVIHNKTLHRLNPVQTLNENIADITGIKALSQAFAIHSQKHPLRANIRLPGLEHINSNKLLFIIWAHTICDRRNLIDLIRQMRIDKHSPAPFRITGTLTNTNSFSNAYQCAKGTMMNPIDKCGIW